MSITDAQISGRKPRLTKNQLWGFGAAWGGWALDGMDSFIYALVIGAGAARLAAAIGEFLAMRRTRVLRWSALRALSGWLGELSLVWGPIADRSAAFARSCSPFICYSTFTFLGAVATHVWQLAAFRFVGRRRYRGRVVHGRQPSLPRNGLKSEERWAPGLMHTGYYFGHLLDAIANYTIGAATVGGQCSRSEERRRCSLPSFVTV